MVLAELGSRLTKALSQVSKEAVIDEKVIKQMLNEISVGLMESDVNVMLVGQMKKRIESKIDVNNLPGGINKRNYIKNVVFEELCALLEPGTKPYQPVKRKEPNVIMFVGLQGSGKTTTCTKYALFLQRKGWRVALVCADTFRAGAFDQLKQNATKANIPFYGSYTETDPVILGREGVKQFTEERFEIIIVDTSGRHKQEESLFEEMEQVAAAVKPDDVVFVMDSSIGQAAHDQAAAFKSRVSVGSVIVTKLDGHARGGGALSAVAATKSPITFIGTGEQFDEFEEFDAQSFVGRLLGMGHIPTLIKRAQDVMNVDKQRQTLENLKEGKYTVRDMREHFQMIMNMGPLTQLMSYIPGADKLMGKGAEKESAAQMKLMMTIMDSMNDDEMDHPNINKIANLDSRMVRIARGSGRSVEDVKQLLEQLKLFQSFIPATAGMGLAAQNQKQPSKELKKQMRDMPKMLNNAGLGKLDINGMMRQMGMQMPNMGRGGRGRGGMPNLGNMGAMQEQLKKMMGL
jgi:signal recognition particle subunit SRP54